MEQRHPRRTPKSDSDRYFTIDGLNPFDRSMWDVHISHSRLDFLIKRSKAQAHEAARTVPIGLSEPNAVFEGLRWDEDEDEHGHGWLCYVVSPPCNFRPDGTEIPPPDGEVFLIFINHERVAYNWRFEKADLHNSVLPRSHDTRFNRRLL